MMGNWTKKTSSDESLVEKPAGYGVSSVERKPGPVLVIHGGAGLLLKKKRLVSGAKGIIQGGTQEGTRRREQCLAVWRTGDGRRRGSSHYCPLFNAAHGAVFNADGKNELEASIMLSHPPPSHPSIPASRKGLSLTLLTRAKNPSQMARALYLEPSLAPHAFLSGAPAEEIGHQVGQELVDPSYYWTEHRWREHRRGLGLPETPPSGEPSKDMPYPPLDQLPTGTVGAVALDANGHIACCTSTGGKTNKLAGRIGDTPSMGSGFWAEAWSESKQGLCAKVLRFFGKETPRTRAVGVSGTGDGDYFIREATAVTLARRMRYQGQSLKSAAQQVVEDLRQAGGMGGVIALDNLGNVAMPMNSAGMYRGVIDSKGEPKVAIFDDDALE